MSTGQNRQSLVDVVNGLFQHGGEFTPFLDMEQFFQGLRPCFVLIGSPPRGQLGAKGPHGQSEAGEAKALFSKFEQLGIAKRRVVLLLMNPIFSQEPFDESLCVALGDHAHGPKGSVKAGDLA